MAIAPEPPLTSGSHDDWFEFLRRALEVKFLQPRYGGRDSDLHHALINVHRSLTAPVRHAFDDAIATMFDNYAASPAAVSELFVLLQVVAYAKPPKAKQMLLRCVTAEILSGRAFGAYDLHALALAAASKYTVDDVLVDYVDRSVQKSSDLGYVLTCFRTRAAVDPDRALQMLPRLVSLAPTTAHVQMIARELRGFVATYGFRPLSEWYLGRSRVGTVDAEAWRDFEVLLLERVAGDMLTRPPDCDAYRNALSALLLSMRRPLAPLEYAAVSELDAITSPQAADTVRILWRNQLKNGWRIFVFGPDEYDKADDRPDDAILLVRPGMPPAYVSTSRTPGVAALLLQLEQEARRRRSGDKPQLEAERERA